MPTYDYECQSCGHVFEAFQSISANPLSECEKCGKEVKRLIGGGAGIIFKGSGFYVNDYKASKGAANGKSSSKEESKKDSAPCACAGGDGCPAASGE